MVYLAHKRPLFVTMALYVGSYWVKLQNSFDFLEKLLEALENDRCLLSNCFLMAVEMSHDTARTSWATRWAPSSVAMNHYLIAQWVMVETQNDVQAVRWDVLCLTVCLSHNLPSPTSKYCEQFAKSIESRNIEMHKVIRGCILSNTGFSGTEKDDQDAKVTYFFQLLSFDDQINVQNSKPHKFTSWLMIEIWYQVQQAILEIVQLHMFRELVWVSMGQHSNGLAEGNSQGRIADLFPKKIKVRMAYWVRVWLQLCWWW